MTLIRRNPLQTAVGALLAVGLVVTALVTSVGRARGDVGNFTGCGYG